MANQQPAEGAKPGDGPFDDPAMAVGSKTTPVLVAAVQVVAAIGASQHDAACGQPAPVWVTVVGAVPEQMFRVSAVRQHPRLQRGVEERDLGRRRRGNGDSQRNTLTLDQYHAL
jgi:hypothetical protein